MSEESERRFRLELVGCKSQQEHWQSRELSYEELVNGYGFTIATQTTIPDVRIHQMAVGDKRARLVIPDSETIDDVPTVLIITRVK